MAASRRFSLFLVDGSLQHHYELMGSFPADVAMVGVTDGPVRYQPNLFGSSYTLSVGWGEELLQFQPGDDLSPFRKAYLTLLR